MSDPQVWPAARLHYARPDDERDGFTIHLHGKAATTVLMRRGL
jgi:hypothetical protein